MLRPEAGGTQTHDTDEGSKVKVFSKSGEQRLVAAGGHPWRSPRSDSWASLRGNRRAPMVLATLLPANL